MNKEDYLQLLVNSFEKMKQSYECPPESRLEFLSLHVFDFTTYDSELDIFFARKAVEVCRVMRDRTASRYIKDSDNYRWFIALLNMPFFAERIEWGTSIRGAFWDYTVQTLHSCGLWSEDSQTTQFTFTSDEWADFISAIIEFAAEEMGEK